LGHPEEDYTTQYIDSSHSFAASPTNKPVHSSLRNMGEWGRVKTATNQNGYGSKVNV